MTVPKTKRKVPVRINIRLPKPMVTEIDRIVKAYPELNYNRQQFVESAIREKIEKLRVMEAKVKAQSAGE